jgi:hypothetical protein
MANMQMTAEEAKEYATGDIKPGDAPKYPYGLCLYLNDQSLKKLGINELPKVGAKLTMTATIVVTSVGSSQQQDGDSENRADLQITDMELGAASRSPDEKANALYGKKG